MTNFKESTRLWFGYEDVHIHARDLFKSMQKINSGPSILIAVGRGGWIPTRLVAASYEEAGLPVSCFSVGVTYRDLGTQSEHVVMTQGLDNFSVCSLIEKIKDGYTVWILDGPYLVGRSVLFVKKYLTEIMNLNGVNKNALIGVLHWIQFDSCPEAPWRKEASIEPDAWGAKIHSATKPYVEYPWEYSTASKFNKD